MSVLLMHFMFRMCEFKLYQFCYLHRAGVVIRAATHSSVILAVFLHSTCLYASGSEHRATLHLLRPPPYVTRLYKYYLHHIGTCNDSYISIVPNTFSIVRSQEVLIYHCSLEGHDFSVCTVPVGRLSAESFCVRCVQVS